MKDVNVANITFNQRNPFVLIAGPCAIENRAHALYMASKLIDITKSLDIPFVYKSSFDKANRSSNSSGRGVGLKEGLKILSEVKDKFDCPIITDVHESYQCAEVAKVIDIIQIPAFLSRQTDLLVAAAQTGLAVNVKKGQFMAPWDMKNVVTKLEESGCNNILLTDRGTSFGYNTLITDFKGFHYLEETGYPIVFDATHSVQQPGGQGTTTGGQRMFIPILARAAVSIGVASVFIECHDNPDMAISDGPNQVPLSELRTILEDLAKFDILAKSSVMPILK